MAEFPAPKDGIVLTHFIVSADVVERSHPVLHGGAGRRLRQGGRAVVRRPRDPDGHLIEVGQTRV